jgi:hypothetical protein
MLESSTRRDGYLRPVQNRPVAAPRSATRTRRRHILVAVGASILRSRLSGRDPPVTATGPALGKCNYELQTPGTSFPISEVRT